jgi:DNA repair protein RadC
LLDIPLLDHVILASDGYVSLRDRGITFDRR